MLKKLFTFITALTLSVGLWAIDGVKYIDADGVEQTANNVTEIAPEIYNWGTAGQTTWYVVTGTDVKFLNGLICNGDVHLILADGAKLSIQGTIDPYSEYPYNTPGIKVSGEGNSLTIYGQTAQTGQLIAKGATKSAGIGGGDKEQGSNITINGGIITAQGKDEAAGIGGGYMGSGSNITINGGIVEATGGNNAAGIGGGHSGSGSNITINGGQVTAIGGTTGAGIGGGHGKSGSDIIIRNGIVIANGGNFGAAIGGSRYSNGSNITILGGHVLTNGGIGNGEETTTTASNIKVAASLTVKDITNSTIIAPGHIDETDIANDLAEKTGVIFINATSVSTAYMDENGSETNITAQDAFINMPSMVDFSSLEVSPLTWGEPNETTWYVINDADAQFSKGAVCAGDVRLILADGAKLTATSETNNNAGIQVSGEDNSLTIYGQTNQSGQLIANGGNFGAGIGGDYQQSGSNITINGGQVTAKGRYGAGIGGGYKGDGSNIAINGGTVTANSASGAGIGKGSSGTAANIYITDAYVLKAGAAADPMDVIAHSSATDLASTLTQRYVKIEGLATPYTRSVAEGQWGTVCLPYAATSFSGADFYKVNYYDDTDPSDLKLYIEPVTALEAGMPYIFEATEAGTLTINHSATTPIVYSAVGNEHGLYGSLVRKEITSDGNLAAISGGQVVIVNSGHTLTVPACRAYIDMSEVPTTVQPHAAPLRVMGVPRGTPTSIVDCGMWMVDGKTTKVIRNGQLVIIREGKEYNAQGQIIK